MFKNRIAGTFVNQVHVVMDVPEFKNEAIAQYITSMVSAMEVYLQDTFVRLIDKTQINLMPLLNSSKMKDIKLRFDDVYDISMKHITLGELIANYYNFQNLKSIVHAFSNLLEVKFIEEIKAISLGKSEYDWYPRIERLLKLRHELIHNFEYKLDVNLKEAMDLEGGLFIFILSTDNFIISYLTKHDLEFNDGLESASVILP